MYRSGCNRAHRWMYGCIAVGVTGHTGGCIAVGVTGHTGGCTRCSMIMETGENEVVMKLSDSARSQYL
jgi:hypothetical protein